MRNQSINCDRLSVAIFVDGGFFIKRYGYLYGKKSTPQQIANHLSNVSKHHTGQDRLYRIFYYDCEPYSEKAHFPLSKNPIDFSKTPVAEKSNELFKCLKKTPKVALRLGKLKSTREWSIHPRATKELLQGKLNLSDLQDQHFKLDLRQKGVDIKIGIDIVHLAYRRLVQKIVLITGDSDFVPATKLARREGIEVILDPMWARTIDESLYEHIDRVKSFFKKPQALKNYPPTPPAIA